MQWVNPLNNSIFLSVHCADLLLAMVQARFKLIKSQVKIKSTVKKRYAKIIMFLYNR